VTLVIDAAPLVALADIREPRRREILEQLEAERGQRVHSGARYSRDRVPARPTFGPSARRASLEDLGAHRYESPGLDGADYEAALDLDRRYAEMNLGLTDLSMVVIAGKLGTRRLLTFDERHFRVVRPRQAGTFTLLPAGA
jgi:uncharacterized protein